MGPGTLKKVNGRWVLAWTDGIGRRRRKVLGADKKVAERRRMEIIRKRDMELDGLGAVEGQGLLLSEIADDYLEDLRSRVSPAHYRNMESRLRAVIDELGPKRVRDLRVMDLVRIRNRATARGAANRTSNLLVDRVRAMLRWAAESGIIAANPVANMKRLPESRDHQRYKRRAMTDDEIERFLAASRHDDDQCDLIADFQRVPQTPLWLFLLETGARWNETRLLGWGDVMFEERMVVFRGEHTKSKKPRAVPLRDELLAELKALRALHENVHFRLPSINDSVFLSPEGRPWKKWTTNAMRIFDRLLERAGVDKVNVVGEKLDIHALRHTANTRLARLGVGVDQRQKLLGHSDPKLTAQTYTHLDVEDLRDAVDLLNKPAKPGKKKAGDAS